MSLDWLPPDAWQPVTAPVTTGSAYRFWSRVSPEPNSGCWLWTGCIMKNGYGRFGVRTGDVRQAHRYALEIFGQPPKADQVVLHLCNVKSCVNPSHLRAGTQKQNIQQAAKDGLCGKGRRRRGSESPAAALTSAEADWLRFAHARGWRRSELATLLKVSWQTVDNYIKRRP